MTNDSLATTAGETPFGFGRNWSKYLTVLTPERIDRARESLKRCLGSNGIQGKTLLDLGSGSGLFSLAARQLGARVTSVDVDRDSVECARELKRRHNLNDADWTIQEGSALDRDAMRTLGTFDVVYSWGVLHHTGDMWSAIDVAAACVAPGGALWIAIYNDQGDVSKLWTRIKRLYNKLPAALRPIFLGLIVLVWCGASGASRFVQTSLASAVRVVTLKNPFVPWIALFQDVTGVGAAPRDRGMHWWYDMVDWVGGYPFEVASPEQIFRFLKSRGFLLLDLRTCGGGLGCNEFVFRRTPVDAPAWLWESTESRLLA